MDLEASSSRVQRPYKKLLMLVANAKLAPDDASTKQTIAHLKGYQDSMLLSETINTMKSYVELFVRVVRATKNVLPYENKEATKSFLTSVIK